MITELTRHVHDLTLNKNCSSTPRKRISIAQQGTDSPGNNQNHEETGVSLHNSFDDASESVHTNTTSSSVSTGVKQLGKEVKPLLQVDCFNWALGKFLAESVK